MLSMIEIALTTGFAIGCIIGLLIGVAIARTYHTRRLEAALRELREALQ